MERVSDRSGVALMLARLGWVRLKMCSASCQSERFRGLHDECDSRPACGGSSRLGDDSGGRKKGGIVPPTRSGVPPISIPDERAMCATHPGAADGVTSDDDGSDAAGCTLPLNSMRQPVAGVSGTRWGLDPGCRAACDKSTRPRVALGRIDSVCLCRRGGSECLLPSSIEKSRGRSPEG